MNASTLRSLTHRFVVPVLIDSEGAEIPTVLSIVNSIQKTAAKKGLAVQIFPDYESIVNSSSTAKETIILVGFASPKLYRILSMLRAAGKQVVITNVDTDHIDARYSCVSFSRRLATEQTLDYLIRRGAERIAMIGCGIGSSNDDVHAYAMKNYLNHHSMVSGKCFYYQNEIQETFDAFYKEHSDYDTVLSVNPYIAVAFLRFCEDHNIKIPENLMLACMKDSYICRYCKPSITCLSENVSLIGEEAIVVWQYLENASSDDVRMRISVMGNIVERESTKNSERIAALNTNLQNQTEEYFEGGPFYKDDTVRQLMALERCLSQCDELDYRIIDLLIQGNTYERISEQLFLSTSALQHRINKYFQLTNTKGRAHFMQIFETFFTKTNHLDS